MNNHEEAETDDKKFHGNNTENGGNLSPEDSENTVQDDMYKSDSRAPLKTPVKDGEPEVQVKFSINDSVNGKGKCIGESVMPSFSGLSKEELLKYANDPFWIRMRLFLFVFFWMVWIAMFVGAVLIIVMAPKCEPPKKPEWYEQGPLYEVDVSKFAPEGSGSLLQRMKSKLDYLSNLQIKGVIFTPIFPTDEESDENTVDYKSVDEKFGTIQDFKELLKDSKDKGINIILSFVPNHSSDKHGWFNKSIAKESPFDNYYVWKPAAGVSPDGSKIPPNNWLSLKGGSAWEWVEERQEFYLHQFDKSQPDLNYHNPLVVKELEDILSYWLELGVSGFNLDKVQYLLEDPSFKNEIPGEKPGAVHTQYEFYSHKKTHNIPGVADILSSWRQIIRKKTEDKGVLVVTGDVPVPTDSNTTTVVVDITRNDKLLKDLSKDFTAKDIYPRLQRIIESKETWPSVQLGDRFTGRVSSLFGEKNVDGLNMLTMLLPATPITFFGEELGLSDETPFSWGNETRGVSSQQEAKESHYNVYKALVEARDTQTVLYGNSSLKILNDSVLIFTRVHLGNPGYLVAFNPSASNVTADLSNLDFVPNDLMIYTKSVDFPLEGTTAKDKVTSKNLSLPAKSAVVFTFAPKE